MKLSNNQIKIRSTQLNKKSITIKVASKDSLMLTTRPRRTLKTRRNSLMMLLSSEKSKSTRRSRTLMKRPMPILKDSSLTKSNKSKTLRKPSTSGTKKV